MLVLGRTDLEKLLTPRDVIDALAEAFRAYAAGRTTVPPRGSTHSSSGCDSRNASTSGRFTSSIARARPCSVSSREKARTASRSATMEPVPSTMSRVRRKRSASAGEAIVHPQRRPANPYDFVRLLVVMNTSPRVAAGTASGPAAS